MQNFFSLLSRVLIAAFFIHAGFGKILAHAGTVEHMAKAGIPYAAFFYYAAVLVEFGGGILLVLGARAGFTAAVLAAYLVPTTYYFHFNLSDHGQIVQLLKNAAIAGGLLQIAAFGAGRFSLDGK